MPELSEQSDEYVERILEMIDELDEGICEKWRTSGIDAYQAQAALIGATVLIQFCVTDMREEDRAVWLDRMTVLLGVEMALEIEGRMKKMINSVNPRRN